MKDDGADLQYYLGVLKRRLWLIVLCTVVVAAAAYGLSTLQGDVYEARADVLIGRQASDQVFSGLDQSYDAQRNVETEVRVLESRTIQAAVTESLGHVPDVRVESDEESNVVTVVAQSDDPGTAARDANAYAQAYVDYRVDTTVGSLIAAGQEVQSQIDDIDDQLAVLPANSSQRAALEDQRSYLVQQQGRLEVSANLATAGGAAVLAEAAVPEVPVAPKPMRNAALGALVGLLLGIGLALLLEHFDDTIKDRAAFERALGAAVPVLGEIPVLSSGRRQKPSDVSLVVADDPTAPASEAFSMLRTSLLYLGIEDDLQAVQITSAQSGEGKSTVAANLAVSLARAGKKVLLVDLDLRRPTIHLYFGLRNRVGFTTALLESMTLGAVLSRVAGIDRLGVVTSGALPPNPSELLSGTHVPALMRALTGSADITIVDSPPVLPVADALAIAHLVDGTIVVGRAGTSSRREMHRAIENLRQVNARVVGAVLNGVDPGTSYGYGKQSYAPGVAASPNGSDSKPARAGKTAPARTR